MTREQKNILTGVSIVIIVYIATLWQRPLFAPDEFNFAVNSMNGTSGLTYSLNSLAGKILKYNIVSVRLVPALSTIVAAIFLKRISGSFFPALIFLSTPLVFIFGTASSNAMINTLFLICGTAAACKLFSEESKSNVKKISAALTAGCFWGFFLLDAGVYALPVPAAAVAILTAKNRKFFPYSAISAASTAALLFAGAEKGLLRSTLGASSPSTLTLCIAAGFLPWILFLPQAVSGVMSDKKSFISSVEAKLSLGIVVSGVLLIPFYGANALVWISPFTALLSARALDFSKDNLKMLKVSEISLKCFAYLLLSGAIIAAIFCSVKTFPAAWKLYYSKMELAGFIAAISVAFIQFKIACDEKPQHKTNKILHTATGVAALMILLPGAIPERIKTAFFPEEFFSGIAARHLASDSFVCADKRSSGAVKWILRNKNIKVTTSESKIQEALSGTGKVMLFTSNDSDFSKAEKFRAGKSDIYFSRGKWKVRLYRSSATAKE